MDNQLSLAAQISVLRTLTAFLLARDSVSSGRPLNELHQALVNEYQSLSELMGSQQAEFEALSAKSLDGVFSQADSMRNAMLK